MAAAAKLPKRVAGVKLPPRLRRAGNALFGWARGPIGSNIVAAALAGVIGAIWERHERRLAIREEREADADAPAGAGV